MEGRVRVPERVLHPAGAVFVTQESVLAGGAETVLAARPFEAVVAQTRPVDVVALGPVLTVALVGALRPVGADGAFVLAPVLAEEEEVTHGSLAGVQLLWRIKGFKNLSDSFTDNWSTSGLSLGNSYYQHRERLRPSGRKQKFTFSLIKAQFRVKNVPLKHKRLHSTATLMLTSHRPGNRLTGFPSFPV